MHRMGRESAAVDSVTFDRAVDYYDRTRSLSTETMAHIVNALSEAFAGRSPCLEIGVGTGRMALPLHRAGIPMIGLDLSRPMLEKLVGKADGFPFPLIQGDATRLPVRDGGVGAALVCHVFHLLSDWRRSVDELVRVVGRNGAIAVDLGQWPEKRWGEMQDRFASAAGIPTHRRFLDQRAEVDAYLESISARFVKLDPITEKRQSTYRESIQGLEDGLWSFTWAADQKTRKRAADEVRAWVREEIGDLDEVIEFDWRVVWRICEL
jgi:ubiquinone/menaquinone biosynthesis C-methylase UbiE